MLIVCWTVSGHCEGHASGWWRGTLQNSKALKITKNPYTPSPSNWWERTPGIILLECPWSCADRRRRRRRGTLGLTYLSEEEVPDDQQVPLEHVDKHVFFCSARRPARLICAHNRRTLAPGKLRVARSIGRTHSSTTGLPRKFANVPRIDRVLLSTVFEYYRRICGVGSITRMENPGQRKP